MTRSGVFDFCQQFYMVPPRNSCQQFSRNLREKFRIPVDRNACIHFWNNLCQKWSPPFFHFLNKLMKKSGIGIFRIKLPNPSDVGY
jgi:hypothetical protein